MAIEKTQVRLEAAGSVARPSPADVSLDDPALKKRLAFDSPQLMGELYEITTAEIQAERGRQGRIEAKATALLTATGLSLTVAFTFGAVLFAHRTAFAANIGLTVTFFLGAIVCGISAAWSALGALRVETHFGPAKEAIFHEELLKDARDADEDAANLMKWRKSMIRHLWKIIESHRALGDIKARKVRAGQRFFVGFLVAVMILSMSAATALLMKP